MQLRPYQLTDAEKIRQAYRDGFKHPLYVAPTGSGKTVLFAHITAGAAAKGNRVMAVAHRQEIVGQISRAFTRENVEHGLIIGSESMNQVPSCQVASVQTLVKRFDKVIPPNLVIFDEAHHCASKTWLRVREQFPASKSLGTTATPERLSGEPLTMFDTIIRGPEVLYLIRDGFLAPPVYFAPPGGVDMSNAHTVAGDFNKRESVELVDRPQIVGDCVAHYAKICPNVPAIVFCISIEHAEHVAEAFRAGGFRADSIDGTLSDCDRRDRVESLADGRLNVLTSVDLISEGFDLPVVGAAIILRPTQSLALHLQQLGRALRPSPGKTRAVILDHVGNLHRHGLAEEKREWSLEGYAKKKQGAREGSAGDRLAQCPKCYAVHQPAPVCPCCGHTYVPQGREIAQVDGQLVEIAGLGASWSGKKFAQCPACKGVHAEGLDSCPKCNYDYKRARRNEQSATQTFDELVAMARRRGYKNPHGFASHLWRARAAKKSALLASQEKNLSFVQ